MALRIAAAFTAVALLSAAVGDVEADTNPPGAHDLRGTMPTSPSRELTPDERRVVEARLSSQPLISAAQPETIAAGMENNTDRPGADVMRFTLPRGTGPESCRSACSPGGRCKAWTYVRPGVQGPEAVCYIKDAVPAARANACCISGLVNPPRQPRPEDAVREPASGIAAAPAGAAEPIRVPRTIEIHEDEIWPGMENNTDRPGRDIQRLTMKRPAYSTPMEGEAPRMIGTTGVGHWAPGQAFCRDACWENPQCAAWTYVRRGVQGPDAVCYLKGQGTAKVSNPCCISGLREPPGPQDPSVLDQEVLKAR